MLVIDLLQNIVRFFKINHSVYQLNKFIHLFALKMVKVSALRLHNVKIKNHCRLEGDNFDQIILQVHDQRESPM
jgi:hypothetical protein